MQMARKKQKQPNKGFKRSQKEWEESIAGHIGKAIDNGKMTDYLLNAGLALIGIQQTGSIYGAVIGPLALKLAQAPGGTPPISQIAGISILGGMGLTSLGILDHLYEAYNWISSPKDPLIKPEGEEYWKTEEWRRRARD